MYYKHSWDTGLTLMGYLINHSPKPEADSKTKVGLSGDGRNNGSLSINSLSVKDSGVYFCAA